MGIMLGGQGQVSFTLSCEQTQRQLTLEEAETCPAEAWEYHQAEPCPEVGTACQELVCLVLGLAQQRQQRLSPPPGGSGCGGTPAALRARPMAQCP